MNKYTTKRFSDKSKHEIWVTKPYAWNISGEEIPIFGSVEEFYNPNLALVFNVNGQTSYFEEISRTRLWHILYLLSVTIWSITINLLLLITIEVVNSYSLIRISSIFSIKRQSIKRLFKKSIVQTIVTFLIWILIIALNRVWSYVYCNMKNVWNLVDSKNAI